MLLYSDSTNAYIFLKTDFISASTINLTCLDIEIENTDLADIYEFALTDENDPYVLFMFSRPLSIPEELTLTGIIETHTGTCVVPDTVAETKVINPEQYEVLTYDATSGVWINALADHDHLENLDNDTHTQYVPTDASRGMSADWNAGNINIRADAGFTTKETDVHLASYSNITGLISGGDLTINSGDPTLLDISAGTGIYVNMEDPTNPHVKVVRWNDMTIDGQLDGYRSKWVGIDVNSSDATAIVKTLFTSEEKRHIIVLGKFWGTGTAIITTVKNYSTPAFNFGKTVEDISTALGAINIYGNNYEPSDVNLKLKRTVGSSFRFSANYENNQISPHIYKSPEADPQNVYQYHLRGKLNTESKSLIDPNYYDVDGTAVLITTGKWTVQRVYYFPVSNTTHVVYGQKEYDSKSLAYDGIIQDDPVLNEDILSGSILRCYLILKQGCSDLSDSTQCQIVQAYSEPGLVPGFTNHGQLGGLQDDDHPQYHNDARADALYYRKEYIEQSENIKWKLPWSSIPELNVKEGLDYLYYWVSDVGYSGRITPEEVLILDGTTNILVKAGMGLISNGDLTKRVTWDSSTFIDIGFYEQGIWYFYVDEYGIIQITKTFNSSFNIIKLGFVLVSGYGYIGSIVQYPYYINAVGNRVIDQMYYLGPFIANEESGIAFVSDNDPFALTFSQTVVHWALSKYILPELDTVDDLEYVYAFYKAADGNFYPEYWFLDPNGGAGKFQGDRWNDITQNQYDIEPGNFTFTQGSKYVTVTDSTTVLDSTSFDDYYIFLESDGVEYMTPIQEGGVDTTGSVTTITLVGNYNGAGGTGNAGVVKALPRVPSGKYSKYIAIRLLDKFGSVYFLTGTTIFDNENDAKESVPPDYPDYIKKFDVKICYMLGNRNITGWKGHIYDLRPIPFYREGGNGIGGGTFITSHSSLSDLDNDDHLHYLRTDGTRDLTGKQRYSIHPTFLNDTELVDKKYVDDNFPVDHEDLLNKGTNTHVQIDTHIADTLIHFTEASIDHNVITNTHNLTTDIDHDLLTNTHNLTTDIDHNTITNTHNLTTDIDHDQLTNFETDEHFPWQDVVDYVDANAITDATGVWTAVDLSYAESNTLSSTTSTTYQNKVSVTSPAVAGVYRIGYTMEFNAQQNNKGVQVRLWDNTNSIELAQNSQQTNNNSNWFTFSGFHYATVPANTAVTFILQYKAGTATCQVRNAALELWRVS